MKRPEDRLKPGRKNKIWLEKRLFKIDKYLDGHLNIYLKEQRFKSKLKPDSKKLDYTRSAIVNRAIALYFGIIKLFKELKIPQKVEYLLFDDAYCLEEGKGIQKNTLLYKALELFAKKNRKLLDVGYESPKSFVGENGEIQFKFKKIDLEKLQ